MGAKLQIVQVIVLAIKEEHNSRQFELKVTSVADKSTDVHIKLQNRNNLQVLVLIKKQELK